MSTKQYNHAYLLPGREWSVTKDGEVVTPTETTETYEVFFAAPVARANLFTSVDGLPAIGSTHPAFQKLIAQGYTVKEGTGGEKNRYEISVVYQPVSSTGTPEEGEEGEQPECYVESIGWRTGSVSRDLVVDAETGVAVLNTAGQPYESVPQVDRPSPTWFKVFKTKDRQSSYVNYYGCVNGATMTVGSYSCAKDTLRCVQADEEMIFNDPAGYKYRYSIALQWMSNKVKLRDANTMTECGWQIAIVSMGTVQRTQSGLKRITVPDQSGNEVPVSAPVLLDGNGAYSSSRTDPYTVAYVAYPRRTFPAIFTSEPTIEEVGGDT
jgi:hypothetical protein